MNLLKFVPIKLTFFLILGILIGKCAHTSLPFSLTFTGSSFIAMGFVFFTSRNRNSIFFGVLMTLTTLSIGLLSYTIWQPKNWGDHYSHYTINEGNTLKLKIREVLKSNAFSHRYLALIKETNGHKTSGKIIFTIPIDTTKDALLVDNELLMYGILNEIKAPLNPHQFDYRKYLNNLGISHQLKGTNDAYFLSKRYAPTLYGFAASARNELIKKLEESDFGTDELSIIQALLLGQRNSISAETYDNYKDAGAVHILAVSGLHIGILLLLLQFLLSPCERLPKGKTIKLVIIVVLLWCFALLAGLSASVVRAVTMFSFVAYALYLNRPSNTFNILALSMFFILLLFNPMLLFQVGFQMSYAAVFAIVWVYPMLQRFWYPKNKIIRKIWQLLSVSIAAQLGVLPISLFYFHQFPGLFFISNLLVVPFLGILLAGGILVLVLGFLNALPNFLVDWYGKMIGMMNTVIEWVAQQEVFIFKNISFDGVQLVLAYGIIITLLIALMKPSFKKVLTFLIVVIGFQLWVFYLAVGIAKKERLLVLHQTKNAILLHQKGNQLTIHSTKPDKADRLLEDFVIGERIEKSTYKKLKNNYQFNSKQLIIIDSTGVYPSDKKPEYLLLTQSPRLHLERLLDSIQPKNILADGSNYSSAIERWRRTCSKRKLPFYYTGEKGAYYFE